MALNLKLCGASVDGGRESRSAVIAVSRNNQVVALFGARRQHSSSHI